jgi:hypothetical protein
MGIFIADDGVSLKIPKGDYTITNSAGHTTKLIFTKTYSGKFLTFAQLTGIQYDSAPVIKLPNSYFIYLWQPLSNSPLLMSQTIYVNGTYSLEALYDAKANQTTVSVYQKGKTIQTEKLSGLETPKLTTNQGVVGYEL